MIIGLLLSNSAIADIEVSDSLGMAFESTTPVLSASSMDSGQSCSLTGREISLNAPFR